MVFLLQTIGYFYRSSTEFKNVSALAEVLLFVHLHLQAFACQVAYKRCFVEDKHLPNQGIVLRLPLSVSKRPL